MKINKTAITIAICCLGSLTATNVSGALVDITVSSTSGGFLGLTSKAWGLTPGEDGVGVTSRSSTWSGGWNATINTGPTAGFSFLSFCTDIGNSMGNGRYTYDAVKLDSAPLNTPEGVSPDPNWATSVSGRRASYIYNANIGFVNANNNAVNRAAMCIAIWEALYEDGLGQVSGTGNGFSVSTKNTGGAGFNVTSTTSDGNTAITLANSWLLALPATGSDWTWFREQEPNGIGNDNGGHDVQSLIGPANAVPEPSTYIAGGLLLLPFFASTIKAWRRKSG